MSNERRVTTHLKKLTKQELSPLELTRALAERLNVRIEECAKENRNELTISKGQGRELCYALSLLIKELEDAEDTLLPQHAAAAMTSVALRDFDRWRVLYDQQRLQYRDLALRFVQSNSLLSEEDTIALFEKLDTQRR